MSALLLEFPNPRAVIRKQDVRLDQLPPRLQTAVLRWLQLKGEGLLGDTASLLASPCLLNSNSIIVESSSLDAFFVQFYGMDARHIGGDVVDAIVQGALGDHPCACEYSLRNGDGFIAMTLPYGFDPYRMILLLG